MELGAIYLPYTTWSSIHKSWEERKGGLHKAQTHTHTHADVHTPTYIITDASHETEGHMRTRGQAVTLAFVSIYSALNWGCKQHVYFLSTMLLITLTIYLITAWLQTGTKKCEMLIARSSECLCCPTKCPEPKEYQQILTLEWTVISYHNRC